MNGESRKRCSPFTPRHCLRRALRDQDAPTARYAAVVEVVDRVVDRVVGLDEVPDGYRAMADRESIKVMVRP